MLARPALRSRLSWARARADLVRALERLHPLDEGTLGGSHGGLGGRLRRWRHGRRVYIASARPARPNRPNSPRPQLEVEPHRGELDGNAAVCRTFSTRYVLWRANRSSAARRSPLLRDLAPAPRRRGRRPADRGSDSVPTATRSAPASQQVGGVTAALDPAHPDDRDRDRARATSRDLRERDRADRRARTRRRCRRRATARRAGAGRSAMPRSVLISETASAPCASAAAATAAGDAQFGVSLTISGLAVSGRTASSSAAVSPGSAPMISPVSTFGQETLSSSAATSSRSANASTSVATSLAREAHDVDDQRHRQLGELGQVVREVAVEALVGQADRVDQPGRQLPQPRRRVALARLERDGLGDEGGEREALEQRVAERAPGGDRVEGARRVDDRVRERDAAEVDHAHAASSRAASSTGPSTHSRT